MPRSPPAIDVRMLSPEDRAYYYAKGIRNKDQKMVIVPDRRFQPFVFSLPS